MHNYGQIRQLDVSVGIAYDSDLKTALAVIDSILANNPAVLRDPAPLVQVATLADSSVEIAIRPWVAIEAFQTAHGEINQAVLETFRSRDIQIPFPQREVRLLGQA